MDVSAEIFIAHQIAYSFLGKVFYEPPTLELVQTLVTENLFMDWPLDTANPDACVGLDQLREFTAQWDTIQYEGLRRDFARLFVGPNRLLAPPWESVYRSSEHLIFDRQTLEVRQQYSRYGMELQHSSVEPDDHIGLELRFVAHLNGLALFALKQDNSDLEVEARIALERFLRDHLLQWAPEFLGQVMISANTLYYRAVAQLTLGCLNHTVSIFSAQPTEP